MIELNGIRNILFDLGGVLYALNYGKTQAAFAALAARGGGMLEYSKAKQDPIFDAFETGHARPEQFRARVQQLLGLPVGTPESDAAIDAAWNAILLGPMPGRAELLARLKSTYRLALLSNTNYIHWAVVRPQIEVFAPHFEQMFASNLVGLRKPDAPFYHYALERLGWAASDTLFIDDIEANVHGARAAGLHAYHLTDPDELLSLA